MLYEAISIINYYDDSDPNFTAQGSIYDKCTSDYYISKILLRYFVYVTYTGVFLSFCHPVAYSRYGMFASLSHVLGPHMAPHLETIIKKMIESLCSSEGVKVNRGIFLCISTCAVSKFLDTRGHLISADVCTVIRYTTVQLWQWDRNRRWWFRRRHWGVMELYWVNICVKL